MIGNWPGLSTGEKLLDKGSHFGKEYLKLLVDDMQVQGREIKVRGGYSALAMAKAEKKLGEPGRVPSFRDAWLTRVSRTAVIDTIESGCYLL